MKWVNQKYNDHIYDLGRQFNATLYLYNNNASYVDAYSVDVVNYNAYGDMCRTAMQEYSFECDTDLETLDLSNYKKFILKTEIRETGAIGPTSPPLYITEKKYSEDKKTYEYKMCDAMVKTMIPYDWETINGNVNSVNLYALIQNILTYVIGSDTNITYNINNLPSGISDVIIKRNSIDGLSLTCRDVLDMALELCGTSMRIHQNKYGTLPWCVFQCVNPKNATSNYTADEDIIRDDTAYAKQKYGPVNSILFESEINESDNLERKDDTSIANNGITQYKVSGNFLLDNDNRATAINMLYNRLNGLEYYLCDLRTIGYMALEIYDNITISLNSTNYLCKLTKNIFTLSNGLEETIVSEKPTQTYDTYESGSPYDDKKARIDVDKLKGEIVLKTDSDGKISKVRLDSSGDDGSLVEIKADNIKLEGYTTINGNFKIDNYGNMECKNAKLIGGQMTVSNALPDEGYIIFEGTYQSLSWVNNFFLFQQYLHDSNYYRSYTSGYNSVNDYMYVRLRHNVSNDYQAEMIAQSNQAKVKVTKNDYGYGLDAVDGVISISDRKAKDNIKDIDEKKSMNIITKLNPVEFNYKKDEKTHRGLIAQDVVEVLKDNDIEKQVYAYDEEKDLYSLNYIELIPDLINCIKYQQKEIEELKEQIEKLSKK